MATQWFYTPGTGQQRVGPLSMEQLKGAAAAGQLQPEHLIWRVGMPQWAAAATVAGLFAGANGAPLEAVKLAPQVGAVLHAAR